jgi:hypothetical protein
MAKAKTPKLKVFQTQFGFYDSIVAASGRAAALRAWDSHQNLFASGQAKITTDISAIEAATAYPGIPLRRAIGSTEAFSLDPSNLPNIPDVPNKAKTKLVRDSKSKAPARRTVDRSRLQAAQTALILVDEPRKVEEADFQREEQELEMRRAAAQRAYLEARKLLSAKVKSARNSYLEAGGSD